MPTSDLLRSFTSDDFDPTRVNTRIPTMCPIKSCSTKLSTVTYRNGKRALPFCSTHEIRLHTKTFVYYNGALNLPDARLRNFIVRPDLAKKVALKSKQKAENYRLGYEMSEDALSWNVFVSLAEAGELRNAANFLIGRDIGAEPDLYLWGDQVDVRKGEGKSDCRYKPLTAAILKLENNIRRFKTEPDIMLVLNGRIIICIEAKFGSGNPLAHSATAKLDEKPVDCEGLLARYLDEADERTRAAIDRGRINAKMFHSQLFRNVIFASEMANGGEWHVVNLVSDTQWKLRKAKTTAKSSFEDPQPYVQRYLRGDHQNRFHFRSWEDLHRKVITNNQALAPLGAYIKTKSAHYEQAFQLD